MKFKKFREENSKVRIKKYSAGKLCEYINGVRPFLESKNAIQYCSLSLIISTSHSSITLYSKTSP